MKKLMFATALVASVAAFADASTAINAVGFEGFSLGATFQNYGLESNDAGEDGPYFYFEGTSNSSVVTNESPATAHTAFFDTATNSKYLALDTEGGTFWRGLKKTKRTEGEDTTYDLGDVQTFTSTIYLDTLVQFTVTEDEAPTTGGDDKLAIWLQAGEGTTNLMVKAAVVDDGGGRTETAFTVSGTTVEPGTWYRLTVKAVADITDTDEIPGFQIFLNGTVIAADKPTLTATYLGLIESDSHYADIVAGKYFASLKTVATLQGVGFQGTGAVDEIVWTEDDLFPAGGPTVVDYTFTLTLNANVTGAEVTTNNVAVVLDANGEALIPEGTEVTVANPAFAAGYQLATATTNGDVAVTFPLTFTMGADTTLTITAAEIPPAYPEYVGTDTELQSQYNTWKALAGNTADTGSAFEKQFLLNVAQATEVGDNALVIDSITENETAGWDIVVSTTVNGAALSAGEQTTYNGYLTVLAADTLEGLANQTTGVAYPVSAAANGKVKITVTAGKFMKVQLTTTPGTAPVAGE